MELEVMFNSGEGESKGEEYAKPDMPAGLDDSVSVVHVRISAEHMKRIVALKPGAKLSVSIRGTVQSFEQKMQEGYGSPIGELCVHATELKLSRGSEFDELLEED